MLMKRTITLIISLILIISMAGCGKNADATTANASGAEVAATTNTGTERDGVRLEDLKTGIVYDRNDVSEAYWNEKGEAVYSNLETVNIRFEQTLKRPYTSDEKLQIFQKESFFLQASDMFHMTVNKDSVFYLFKNEVLTKDHSIDLVYLNTDRFYADIVLELCENSDDMRENSYDEQTAKYDRDGDKYETKELNGWKIIYGEFDVRQDEGSAPGFFFDYYYELNDYYFLTASTKLVCDKESADLFMGKFVNNFTIEKVSKSECVAGIQVDNFKKIKLDDKITLNLETGAIFGIVRPENPQDIGGNMVNFVPDTLTFDGTDVTFVKIIELDKSDSDTVYGDTDYEYKDFTYKGIKTTLRFYTSDIDVLGAISGDGVETEKETRLEYIYFETDNYIYGIYAMVGTKEVTTTQDYEAFVTLLLDRMLEVT